MTQSNIRMVHSNNNGRESNLLCTCLSEAGFQSGSNRTRRDPPMRLMPHPPAFEERRKAKAPLYGSLNVSTNLVRLAPNRGITVIREEGKDSKEVVVVRGCVIYKRVWLSDCVFFEPCEYVCMCLCNSVIISVIPATVPSNRSTAQ